jgi:hypothetical protein
VLVATIKEVGKVGNFVDLFLITDIASDDLLIVTRRRYQLPTRPKMIAFVASFAGIFVVNVNRRLALQKADNMRHRIFQWDRYQHVYMLGHEVPFLDPATLLSSKSISRRTSKAFRAVLTREDHMIFAVPGRV